MSATSATKIMSAAALVAILLAGSATAQTGTSSTATSTPTPGLPNTGSGGNAAANMLALTVSAVIALGGAAYLTRRRNAL